MRWQRCAPIAVISAVCPDNRVWDWSAVQTRSEERRVSRKADDDRLSILAPILEGAVNWPKPNSDPPQLALLSRFSRLPNRVTAADWKVVHITPATNPSEKLYLHIT